MTRTRWIGGIGLTLVLMLGAVAFGTVDQIGDELSGDQPSLTVYTGNIALARIEVERKLAEGSHTVRIDGLPTNMDPSSLMVLNQGVVLLGAHGFRSYQDAATGSGASIELDLEVTRALDRLKLAFLTTGLSWSANYAVIVSHDDATARVDGFATVVNNSGAAYMSAEVQLLAGTIRQGVGGRFEADALSAMRVRESAAAPRMQEAAFGDYHIYTVSTPLSLRAGEARRIRLMGATSAVARKEYIFSQTVNYYQQYPEPVTQPAVTRYQIERNDADEFGAVPLPGGVVRVLQRDAEGRIQLLGIVPISNTPKGTDLYLSTGYAFEVVGTRTQTDYSRTAGNEYETAWKVALTNGGDEDVTVQVIERLSGDWRIIESSHASEKLSAGAARFSVRVPAGGEAALEYRVSVRS